MSQQENNPLCRVCKEYSLLFNPIIQPCLCGPIHQACLVKEITNNKFTYSETDMNGVDKIECDCCCKEIYFYKGFKKHLVKFWSSTETLRRFYLWACLLVFQIIFFLFAYFQLKMKILFFDFLFSPFLFTLIIFQLTFKYHKGRKYIICFMIGELALTFTFFFMKMIAYSQNPQKRLVCQMIFRIPLILLLQAIIYDKMKAIFLISSQNRRKNIFLQKNFSIREKVQTQNNCQHCYYEEILKMQIIEVIAEAPFLIKQTQLQNCYFIICPQCRTEIYFYKTFKKKLNLGELKSEICQTLIIIITEIFFMIILMLLLGALNQLYLFLAGWINISFILGLVKFRWMQMEKRITFQNQNIEI